MIRPQDYNKKKGTIRRALIDAAGLIIVMASMVLFSILIWALSL
jgi:hypothetical protein